MIKEELLGKGDPRNGNRKSPPNKSEGEKKEKNVIRGILGGANM